MLKNNLDYFLFAVVLLAKIANIKMKSEKSESCQLPKGCKFIKFYRSVVRERIRCNDPGTGIIDFTLWNQTSVRENCPFFAKGDIQFIIELSNF